MTLYIDDREKSVFCELIKKKAIFICKITAVKKPKEVNIDDEFAKNLGAKDLIDLKKIIKNKIND